MPSVILNGGTHSGKIVEFKDYIPCWKLEFWVPTFVTMNDILQEESGEKRPKETVDQYLCEDRHALKGYTWANYVGRIER